MLNRILIINPIEPALFSLRTALGVPLDLGITFKRQDMSPVDPDTLKPQLALMPRSTYGIFAYDIEASAPEQGIANVSVPGNALFDTAGYNIEIYQRRTADNPADPPVPVGLLAKGVLRLEGNAYTSYSQLAPLAVPTVIGPQGPQGPQGDPGLRGSIWFTGDGDPTETAGKIDGDMYLNNLNGDVWRFNGDMWVLGVF